MGRDGRRDDVVQAVHKTANAVFAVVRAVDASRDMNTLLVATEHLPAQDIGVAALRLPADVARRLAALPQPQFRAARADAWLLTDERAPLELLTDWTVLARLLAMANPAQAGPDARSGR